MLDEGLKEEVAKLLKRQQSRNNANANFAKTLEQAEKKKNEPRKDDEENVGGGRNPDSKSPAVP